MMSIDEYLLRFRPSHPAPRVTENKDILHVLSDVCSEYGIHLRNVYTKVIYPQLLQKDKISYLIWDSAFWDLFDYYMLAIYEITTSTNPNKPYYYDYFMALYFLFLSHRFQARPSISFMFAKRYAGTGFVVPEHNKTQKNRMQISQLFNADTVLLDKMFVLFHEINHHRHKTDAEIRDCQISDFRDMANALLSYYSTKKKQDGYEHVIFSIIGECFERHNTELLCDICCDLAAAKDILRNGMVFGIDSIVTLYSKMMFSLQYIFSLQNNLALIEKKYCVEINDKDYRTIQSDGNKSLYTTFYRVLLLTDVLSLLCNRDNDSIMVKYGIDGFYNSNIHEAYLETIPDKMIESGFVESIVLESDVYERSFTANELKSATNMLTGWF